MSDERAIRNLEAERACIGAMLLDNDRIGDVSGILRPGDFHLAAHEAIYGVVVTLWGAGSTVDVVSVAEAMGREYDRIGGDDLMSRICDVPHAENAAYYAGIVRERAMVRGLIGIAQDIQARSAAMDSTAGQVLDMAQTRIMDLMSSGIRAKVKGPGELADEMRGRLIERSRGAPIGLRTGITDLDAALGYLEPGNMVVIGAKPSMGKTTMILNVCEYLSIRCLVPTLFLSLEMLTGELMDRVVSNIADVNLGNIREGRLTPDEYGRCSDATDAIEASRMFIDDGRGMTLAQVCSTARMYRARRGVELVCIDYIGKVKEPHAKNENRWEVVKRISNRLKDLAGELKLPVVVAAQINRQSGTDRPTMSHLRESGDIEADADIVAILHRPEKYDPNEKQGQIEVIVDKARNAPVGMTTLRWDGAHQRITNLVFPRLQEVSF